MRLHGTMSAIVTPFTSDGAVDQDALRAHIQRQLDAELDGIVPFSMGKARSEAANGPKAFYVIRGAGHNDTYAAGGEAYFQRLDAFIRKLFTADGSAGG